MIFQVLILTGPTSRYRCGLTTPWLRLYRLRCRRRTTDSFNANEPAKHASFIQYVLLIGSPTSRSFPWDSTPLSNLYHLSPFGSGPCGRCRVFKLVARFSFLAEFRFLKSSNSPRLYTTLIYFELKCLRFP